MKKIIIALTAICLVTATNVCAQQSQQQADDEKKARAFLDKVAQKYQNDLRADKGIEFTYESSSFQNRQPAGTYKGTIKIKNNKFFINLGALMIWYDGKVFVQRTVSNNQPAQVTIDQSPKKSELDKKNPYAFLTMYKKGYKLSIDENVSYQGMTCKEVHFISKQSAAEIQEMYAAFDANLNPVSIRLRQGKYNWIRIRVSNFKAGTSIPDKVFHYDEIDGKNKGDIVTRY